MTGNDSRLWHLSGSYQAVSPTNSLGTRLQKPQSVCGQAVLATPHTTRILNLLRADSFQRVILHVVLLANANYAYTAKRNYNYKIINYA